MWQFNRMIGNHFYENYNYPNFIQTKEVLLTMAAFSKWKCERCGFTVETGGPHEFYRDDNGEFLPHGHPTVGSEEAEKKGVKGFYMWVLYTM